MTDNGPIWETFVLLAHAYGPCRAHSLVTETHGADRANRYRNRYIDTYGRRCRARSAADIACTAGVPVIPVAHNGAECWPHKTLIKYPGTITVVVGDPVPVAGRDRKELTDYLQNWIEAQRDAMPTGRADGKRPWQTAEPE